MDAVYSCKIGELRRCVNQINPLATVLGNYLDTLFESGDLVNATADQKQLTKKKYLDWCKKNHPDKKVDEDVDNDALHIYKNFGSAFLRYAEKENETLWMYMGFYAITFHKIDITSIDLSSLYRLIRDCDVLENIVASLTMPGTVADIQKVREILNFIREYLNVRASGHCTEHSTEENLVTISDCPQCHTVISAASTLKEGNDLVIIADDDSSNESSDLESSDESSDAERMSDEKVDEDAGPSTAPSNNGSPMMSTEEVLRSNLNRELNSVRIKTLVAIAKSKDLSTEGVVEKSELVARIIEHDMNDPELRRIRNHKKREHPTKYSVPIVEWKYCELIILVGEDRLPHDIDGLSIYKMMYDPKEKMRNTGDGRKWSTWGTSSRKGFTGTRRTANCSGGYECLNINFSFYKA